MSSMDERRLSHEARAVLAELKLLFALAAMRELDPLRGTPRFQVLLGRMNLA